MREFKICSRCVLDTTVPEIEFDNNGVCQYCKIYDELDRTYPITEKSEQLTALVEKIKAKGKNNEYDCVVGVSGGTDSTYALYKVIEQGLRPLAVHFDNGWNTTLAVENIEKVCSKLNVDLFTYVVDWEEFKDIQISFLKASTSDAETPTDVGILGTLFKIAAKKKIKYILYGHSFRTEAISPVGWSYYDGKYIAAVHKIFGKINMKTFPNFLWYHLIYYLFVRRIKMVSFLNYMDYNKEDAKKIIADKLDWKYSGGHHHESIFTHFWHSYLLPVKFKIDKRKTEFSALILSQQISREKALHELAAAPYPYEKDIVSYAIKKFGFTEDEFKIILNAPIKSYNDYPTYLAVLRFFKPLVILFHKLKLMPSIVYLKYKSIL